MPHVGASRSGNNAAPEMAGPKASNGSRTRRQLFVDCERPVNATRACLRACRCYTGVRSRSTMELGGLKGNGQCSMLSYPRRFYFTSHDGLCNTVGTRSDITHLWPLVKSLFGHQWRNAQSPQAWLSEQRVLACRRSTPTHGMVHLVAFAVDIDGYEISLKSSHRAHLRHRKHVPHH